MKYKNIFLCFNIVVLVFFITTKNINSQTENFEDLDINEALALALENNPEIKAFSSNIEAKDGLVIQAGLYPNSEINVEIENFAGSGAAQGFDEAVTTVLISQLVPIYGKIGKKEKVSRIVKNIAELEYESKRLDVVLSTKNSFIDVLSKQERLEQIEQLVKIAEQVNMTISERVEAGKESPIEEKKSSIEFEQTNLLLTKAGRDLASSRKLLSANWGDVEVTFGKILGDLYSTAKISGFEELQNSISNNPDIIISLRDQDLNSANIKLQNALGVPDPTFGIGYRRLSETEDNALVAEFSMPLPFFNRNQGNIKEASFNLVKSRQEYQNLYTRTSAELAEKYENLKFYIDEIETLEDKILPQSEDTYETILEGYREGKFEFLDVLDSQRTLFNSKLQYIDALRNYHSLAFEIERLTGAEFPKINPGGDDT